ncbi:MAG: pknB 3 [Nocardioides sp.]|nr:pknB 3 [Nocardioides sp.]
MSSSDAVLGDRYELGEVIGRGGAADVYRATDRLLSRTVAVKVLRESAESETDRRRFTSEATMLAGLNHHGLVTVLDAGITVEHPYLVMELVEGETLSQACAAGRLDPALVAKIGRQVADALAYAHEQGVVHRDVKPGNVLLGATNRVKLADFGIARLIGDTVRHTRTGHAIGTPAYLSPEQVRGDAVTTAADVYSLGLVLLEALTGERAYAGTPTEAALARLSRPPEVPATLPPSWRALLTAMTATEPAHRPTAQEVAATLADVDSTRLLEQPVPVAAAQDPSAIDRAGDWLARQPGALAARAAQLPHHLRAVAAVIAGILLLIVVAAFAADNSGSGGSPQDEPSTTPSQVRQTLRSPSGTGSSTAPVSTDPPGKDEHDKQQDQGPKGPKPGKGPKKGH